MLIYPSVSLLCLVIALIRGKVIKIAAITATCLLLTTTYYNGSDWRTYELFFVGETIAHSALWGPGFLSYTELFRSMIPNYQLFAIFSKVLVCILSVSFFLAYSPRPYFTIAVYLLLSGPAFYIDDPLRQIMAMPFFLAALHFIARKQEIRFYLMIFLGSLFHQSILLFFPLFRLVALSQTSTRSAFFVLLAAIALSAALAHLTNVVPLLGFYYRHYLTNLNLELGISNVIFALLLGMVFVMWSRTPSFAALSMQPPIFFLAVAYCVCGLLSALNDDFLRLNHYLVFGFALFFGVMPGRLLSIPRVTVLAVSIALFLNLTLRDYRYIPYTNYLHAMIAGDTKTYDERYSVHLRIE